MRRLRTDKIHLQSVKAGCLQPGVLRYRRVMCCQLPAWSGFRFLHYQKVRRCRVYWKALHLPVLLGWHRPKRYCRYADLSQMHHSYRRSLVHRRCTGTDRSLKYHLERCLVFLPHKKAENGNLLRARPYLQSESVPSVHPVLLLCRHVSDAEQGSG